MLTRVVYSSALLLSFVMLTSAVSAQTTFGTVLGTVTDPSGASVARAQVVLMNVGTAAARTVTTDPSGGYLFANIEPGVYRVAIDAPGFQPRSIDQVELRARQTVRLDAALELASLQETVSVTTSVPIVNSETSNIAQTKTGLELVNLPATLGARAAGTTSPISTLTVQPGVQTDGNGNISVAGGQPSYLAVTVDGISSVGVRTNGPIAELFPSLETIAEIRVSQVNNGAEYGGVSDITTISKSGTNVPHGSGFWNFQSSAMDARNPFSASKPFKRMNDAGGSLGGRIFKDRTFFFGAFEALRLPNQQLLVQSVPSLAFRRGDLSSLGRAVNDPATGQPFPNNQVPVDPASAQLLNLLYPLPNTGAADSQSNNYRQLFQTPVNTNQVDVRIDHQITPSQTAFARLTYKDIDASLVPTTSPMFGPIRSPEKVRGVSAAHNTVLRSNLLNEVRGGYTKRDLVRDFDADPDALRAQIGIGPLPYRPDFAVIPNIQISGYQSMSGNASRNYDRTYQLLDNVTWLKGAHSVKVGGDFRHLVGKAFGVGSVRSLGQYIFNGAVTNLGRNGQTATATNPALVGNQFAAFLLGIPDSSSYSNVRRTDMDAYSRHYAFYGQDDWRVGPTLTVSYGLRYEYHPMFRDRRVNVSNFLPDYVSTVNGVTVRGAVVVVNEEGRSLAAPGYPESIAPTPILTAEEAGVPSTLRYSPKTDWAPRVGFAYRPFGGNKTVIRGGYGKYIVAVLGGLVSATYGTHSVNVPLFSQQIVNGQPTLRFPSPFPTRIEQIVGTQSIIQAVSFNQKDPYVQQWNATIEHEVMANTAIRLTYNGSVSKNLQTTIDQNQVPANTVGYNTARLNRPFPLWGRIQTVTSGAEGRFHALTVEGNRRMSNGVQFQTSYALSKNLSNVNGLAPTSFAGGNGALINDRFDPELDIGNVPYTRRHRFLSTFVVQLPFGRGRLLASNASTWLDAIVGGWDVAGIVLAQSGAFLTATVPAADPSGTGLTTLCSCNGRPDIVAGKSGNLPSDARSINGWFDPAAFVVPQNNIGRFGNAPVGNLIGPGTVVVSASLTKKFRVSDAVGAQFSAQSTNLFNHVNYDIPNTVFNTANFGRISSLQSAEGAGPRVVQLSLRLTF